MATLRDNIGIATDSGLGAQLQDQDIAAGMGSLRRGFAAGRIGNELNPLRTEELDAEIAGDQPRAASLRGQIDALERRQSLYAPRVGRLEDIGGVGDALDYGAGQVGQGVASMTDPMAVSAGLSAVGRAASAVPHPLARGIGLAAQGAALGIPAWMSKEQLTGEFIGEAQQDPELMARTSPQSLRDMAGNVGTLAAIPDSFLPGMVGRQLGGFGLGKGISRIGTGARAALGTVAEGATEAGQNMGSQFAQGLLNPDRDTSGDFMENVNAGVGGAVGGAPFAGAGALADAGFRRTGDVADRIGDKAGETFDLAGEKIGGAFGKAKDTVIDLMADEDGKVSSESVMNNLRSAAEGTKPKGGLSDEELSVLTDMPPADIIEDDARVQEWFNANGPRRGAMVVEKLQAMSDDEQAQEFLQRAAAEQDPERQTAVLAEAAGYIVGNTPSARVSERAAKFGAMAGAAGELLGKGAAALGKGAVAFGKAALDGAKDGVAKKNAQADEGFADWRAKRVTPAEAAEKPGTGTDVAKAEEFGQRADLAAGYVGDMAKRAKINMKGGKELARHAAFNLADMIGQTSGDVKRHVVRLNRITADFADLYKGRAPEVLKQLGSILGPDAGPAVKHMMGELEQQLAPSGRAYMKDARAALADEVVGLVGLAEQAALMKEGINLREPEQAGHLLGLLEDFADGIGAAPGMRKALDQRFGKDGVDQIMALLNGKAADAEKVETGPVVDDRSQIEGEGGEFEQRAGEELVAKGSGPKVYGFGNGLGVRASGETRDPFAPTRATSDDGVVQRPALLKKGQQLFGGKGDAIEKRIADIKKQLQDDPEYPDHDNHDVRARSAHEVMKESGMQPGKILQLYRDYMRMEAKDEKLSDGERNYATQQSRLAHSTILDSIGKQDADGKLQKYTFKTGPKDRAEVAGAAEAYFKERFVVVGEQLSNRDPSKLAVTEVLALHKEGQGLIERSRMKENPALAISDANLLMFKSDVVKEGGEIAVPAGKLVAWVRKQRADGDAKDFKNSTKDDAYLADVSEGIAALVGSGFVKGLPYKLNDKGQPEHFSKGIPPSLRLVTKTYAGMTYAAEQRRESRTGDTIENPDQELVAADQARNEGTFTPDPLEEVEPGAGGERKHTRSLETNAQGLRVDRSGRRNPAPKTDSDDATPLDFFPKQEPGAVPDEFADQQFLTRQTNEQFTGGPEPKMSAVSKAEFRARELMAAFAKDAEGTTEQLLARVRAAKRPAYVKPDDKAPGAEQVVGGAHYIAPIAYLVQRDRVAGMNLSASEKQMFDHLRSEAAGVLLNAPEDQLSRTQVVNIAKLMTPERVTDANVRTVLRAMQVGEAPVVAKQEPAPKGIMARAIAQRQAYLDNPPDDYSSDKGRAIAAWAKEQLARVNAERAKADGDDRRDTLSDYKSGLERIIAKAAEMAEGDASLAKFEGTAPEVAAGAPKDQATLSGGSERKLNAQSANEPDARAKLITRLATGRRAQFVHASKTAVVSGKFGTDSFGPLGREFTHYFARDSGSTHAFIVPDEFLPRLSRELARRASDGAESQIKALSFFSVQHAFYDVVAGGLETFGPRAQSPGAELLTRLGALGDTGRVVSDGSAVTRIEGVPGRDTAAFLANALAYTKHVLGKESIPVVWERTTGGNIGKVGGGEFNAQSGGGYFDANTNTWVGGGPSRTASQADMDGAVAYAKKVLGPKIKVEFKAITGYSGEFIDATNTIEISTTAAAGTLNTLYHEAMHVFFRDFVKGNPGMRAVFESLINDPRHVAKLHALLDGFPAAQAQLSSGEERLAYTYQFWKAGLLQVDVKANTWLQKVGKFFRRVLGLVRDSEKALELFRAFDNGKMSEPSAAGRVIAKALGQGGSALKLRRNLDGVVQGLAALTLPAAEILGKSVSPTARKLSVMMFTNPGEEAHGSADRGMLNARRSVAMQYDNLSKQIMEELSETDQREVQRLLQSGAELASIQNLEHRAAVKGIRAALGRFHQYLTESGMKIGKIKDYYPVVWSMGALLDKKAEFMSMLVTKYAAEMRPVDGDPVKAAERIWQSLVNKEGVDAHLPAGREDGVLSPFFASQEMRTLPWLKAEDREKFLDKNMSLTLSRYFNQGAHSAEYFRRFGENGTKLDDMLMGTKSKADPKVRAEDGIIHELTRASHEMVARKQIVGEPARKKWVSRQMRDISKSVGAMEGALGKDVSPAMRNFNSWMAVYQNVRLLPMSLFSSFVDPLALVARGAPMAAAYEGFVYGMREVFQGWADAFKDMPPQREKDEWRKLAEHIGATEVAMFSHHVADEYSSTYMTAGAKKINDKMFVLNGMEAWNRGSRIMATKWAVRFLEQHAGLPDKVHSERWLRELGLSAADITLDDGKLVTSRHELAALKGITLEQATKEIAPIHAALNRWVEGAVLTPNAAQRPAWSSDPNYATMFHLKQFSYSFHQTILKRAVGEFKHGNLAPLGALVAFVPTMIVSDVMKGLIQGGGSLPPYMAGMNAGDWLIHGVQRAGLGGIGTIGMDAGVDPASLGGPAVEQLVDGMRDGFGEKTMLKAMPLNSLYGQLFKGTGEAAAMGA